MFRVVAWYQPGWRVEACIYDVNHPRVQTMRRCPRTKTYRTKFERAFSTVCDGHWVNVWGHTEYFWNQEMRRVREGPEEVECQAAQCACIGKSDAEPAPDNVDEEEEPLLEPAPENCGDHGGGTLWNLFLALNENCGVHKRILFQYAVVRRTGTNGLERMGLTLIFKGGQHGCDVREIEEAGAVFRRNEELKQEQGQVLQVGDRVLAVNGVSLGEAIAKEMREGADLVMCVSRAGERGIHDACEPEQADLVAGAPVGVPEVTKQVSALEWLGGEERKAS